MKVVRTPEDINISVNAYFGHIVSYSESCNVWRDRETSYEYAGHYCNRDKINILGAAKEDKSHSKMVLAKMPEVSR